MTSFSEIPHIIAVSVAEVMESFLFAREMSPVRCVDQGSSVVAVQLLSCF